MSPSKIIPGASEGGLLQQGQSHKTRPRYFLSTFEKNIMFYIIINDIYFIKIYLKIWSYCSEIGVITQYRGTGCCIRRLLQRLSQRGEKLSIFLANFHLQLSARGPLQMTASHSCLKSIFRQTAVVLGSYHGDRQAYCDRRDWCVCMLVCFLRVSLKEQLPSTGHRRWVCFFHPLSLPHLYAQQQHPVELLSIWAWHFTASRLELFFCASQKLRHVCVMQQVVILWNKCDVKVKWLLDSISCLFSKMKQIQKKEGKEKI